MESLCELFECKLMTKITCSLNKMDELTQSEYKLEIDLEPMSGNNNIEFYKEEIY